MSGFILEQTGCPIVYRAEILASDVYRFEAPQGQIAYARDFEGAIGFMTLVAYEVPINMPGVHSRRIHLQATGIDSNETPYGFALTYQPEGSSYLLTSGSTLNGHVDRIDLVKNQPTQMVQFPYSPQYRLIMSNRVSSNTSLADLLSSIGIKKDTDD